LSQRKGKTTTPARYAANTQGRLRATTQGDGEGKAGLNGSSLRFSLLVEVVDQLIEVGYFVFKQGTPILRVPLLGQFLGSLPLLLHPRVILEVVNRLPLRVGQFLEIIHALVRQRTA